MDGLAPLVRGGRLLSGRAFTAPCRFESCSIRWRNHELAPEALAPMARGAGLESRWANFALKVRILPLPFGKGSDDVAEWRGAGLQSRRGGFDSRRRLEEMQNGECSMQK